MYKKIRSLKTSISRNVSYEGETIEHKMRRILSNKEPITDGAIPIFTERKDGVLPGYDIRTDKWEVFADSMDHANSMERAKRDAKPKGIGEKAKEGMDKEKGSKEMPGDGKAESTGTTK